MKPTIHLAVSGVRCNRLCILGFPHTWDTHASRSSVSTSRDCTVLAAAQLLWCFAPIVSHPTIWQPAAGRNYKYNTVQTERNAEERDQCVTLRGSLEQRYKRTEDEIASLHVRLEQQIDLKKKNDELEDSVTMCKSELDSLNKLDATKTATLEALRLEKDTINTQLDTKKDENKKLQEDLSRIKDELDKLKLSFNAPAEKRTLRIQSPASNAKVDTGISNDVEEEELLQTGDLKNDPADGSVGQQAEQNEQVSMDSLPRYTETTKEPPSGSQKPEDTLI